MTITKAQLESWALTVVDRLGTATAHTEDNFVELKATWTPATEAARQIAGHANAARGESILWIIGVDERAKTVTGAHTAELSTWWNAVKAQFDTVHPEPLMALNVSHGGSAKTFVALLLETDRAPYQVKNPAFGQTGVKEWEVPWRVMNGTITARREHLVRMLTPASRLPELDLRHCHACLVDQTDREGKLQRHLDIGGSIYVVPRSVDLVVIPKHRALLRLTATGFTRESWSEVSLSTDLHDGRPRSELVLLTSTEVVFKGPGTLNFLFAGPVPSDWTPTEGQSIDVDLYLSSTSSSHPSHLRMQLNPCSVTQHAGEVRRWKTILRHDI